MTDIDDLIEEIEDRRDELELEFEDSDLDEIKIKDMLRDEFSDPKYKEALIEAGINEDIKGDLIEKEDDLTIGGDENGSDKILKILIMTDEDIQETEMILRGFKKEKKQWYKSREELLPSEDISEVLLFLRTNFLPQNLMTKLNVKNESLGDYLKSLNYSMTYFNDKFTDYPDHIVSLKDKQFIMRLLLNKCQVVINAIRNGELADAIKQILSSTYHEKAEQQEDKKDKLKSLLNK